MRMIVCVLVFAAGLNANANSAKINCSYVFPKVSTQTGASQTLTAGVGLTPDTTYIYLNFKDRVYSLTHNTDLNVEKYVQRKSRELNESEGSFFALRRDDKGNVIVKATTGSIHKRTVVVENTTSFDFGNSSGSGLTGQYQIGSLACMRF